MSHPTSTLKTNSNSAFVPDSMSSYLMGSLRTDFDHLKCHINRDCAFAAAKIESTSFMKQLLEEVFRYLFLLADDSSDGVIRSSPSYFVSQAFNCLMLDPTLYYRVCNEILNMQGKDSLNTKIRVLPHDALGGLGEDEAPRKARYLKTLTRYKQIFGHDAPPAFWSDYSSDPIALQAELQAQWAVTAFSHLAAIHPHLGAAPCRAGEESASTAAVTPAPPPSPRMVRPVYKSDKITLRLVDLFGNYLDVTVTLGTRFSHVISEVTLTHKVPADQVQFVYKGLLLLPHMMPYSLNMKSGDAISCNFTIVPQAVRVTLRDATTNEVTVLEATTRDVSLKSVIAMYAARMEAVAADYTVTVGGEPVDILATLRALSYKEGEVVTCHRDTDSFELTAKASED